MTHLPFTTECEDVSEVVELYPPRSLYLKPTARVNISVQLPVLRTVGKTISNWEVMEKLKSMVQPTQFLVLKVAKSAREFVRFEAELQNRTLIAKIVDKLEHSTMKLSGFPESLKIRAAEAKTSYPTRHDWDAFFRDAKNMKETKPGQRPDTVVLKNLPCRWFATSQSGNLPSETLVRRIFETFGAVRAMDIPILDSYRKEMVLPSSKPLSEENSEKNQWSASGGGGVGGIGVISGASIAAVVEELEFDLYVQYMEYMSFVKAMEAFRGVKLLYKSDGKARTANIKVEFDKTKHLSDRAVKLRDTERDRLKKIYQEKKAKEEREEEDRKRQEEELRRRLEAEEREEKRKQKEEEDRKEGRQRERERKRRDRQIQKEKETREAKERKKIAVEERKSLLDRRKRESSQLLGYLLKRVKRKRVEEVAVEREKELLEKQRTQAEEERIRKEAETQRKIKAKLQRAKELAHQEKTLREKITKNLLEAEARKEEQQRELLRRRLADGQVRLKSSVVLPRK